MYSKVTGGAAVTTGLAGGSLAHTGTGATAYAVGAVTCILAGAALKRLVRHFRLKDNN